MKELKQLHIQDFLEIALRRKWIIIVSFLVVAAAGVAACFSLPPLYRASTLILVQQQRVPEEYVKPTVTTGIEERLHSISHQILSRTRLETIINELDLYPDLRKALFMEEVVEKMRADITLEVKGKEAFQLFYEGKEPEVVANVANRLASLFIEENLRMREDLAEGTTEFLDRELLRVKTHLEEQELAVRKFKVENMGSLPEQLDANLRTLEQLQLQLQTVSTSVQSAKDSRISLQKQFNRVAEVSDEGDGDRTQRQLEDPSKLSLEQLRVLLASLLVTYTEKHPDVIKVQNQIKKLEEAKGEGALGGVSVEGVEDKTSGSSGEVIYSVQESMAQELADLDLEIRRLEEEQGKIKEKITLYQKRIEETPAKEQELTSLVRDYANTQKNYESLLDRRLNAQIAANMERMQKGERFKILDPARIPQKPFKPNRVRILMLSILLGLGLGIGLVSLTEYLDHSFRNIDDLEQFTGLAVLASIPRIITQEELNKKRIRKRIALASTLSLVGFVAVIVIIQVFVFDFRSLLMRIR